MSDEADLNGASATAALQIAMGILQMLIGRGLLSREEGLLILDGALMGAEQRPISETSLQTRQLLERLAAQLAAATAPPSELSD